MKTIIFILLYIIGLTNTGFILVNAYIIYVQSKHIHYKKTKTVWWFSGMFGVSAFGAFFVAHNYHLHFVDVVGLFLLLIFSVINVATLVVYIKQLKAFEEKQIPKQLVDDAEEHGEHLATSMLNKIDDLEISKAQKDHMLKEAEALIENYRILKQLD